MFCNILGETWLFNYPSRPEDTVCVHGHGLGSGRADQEVCMPCTLERYGSHMLDCSVAKQSLVALSSGEAEFYGIARAVVTSRRSSQILEQIGSATGGDHRIRQQRSTRKICTRTGSGKLRHLSIKELWIQAACRRKEFQLVSVDTLLNWADIGTQSTHVRAPDVVAEAGATSPERGSDKRRWHVSRYWTRNTVQATEGMEKVVMDEPRDIEVDVVWPRG